MDSFGKSPADSLTEEQNAARTLLQLLKQEQDQLVAANIEGLTALTEEKAKVVSRMTELAKQRHDMLAKAGFEPKESGMKAWLASAAAKAASKSWNELLSLASKAKEMNRTNGVLITKHLSLNQNALNALKVGPQGNNFYGPDGQSTTRTTVRGLVIG